MNGAHDPFVRPWTAWAEGSAVAAVSLALLIGMVRAVAGGWTPVADDAFIELLTRDVPAHLPLTGVYSRYGWSHPGPALFWGLSVPYRLSGAASVALLVAAMLGHLAAALGAWWVARRMDRLTGLLVLCGAAAVLVSTEPEVLRSPWNPYVGLVGSALLVVLAWSAASRGRAGLVGLLPVGTLLVQSHVVTAPMVVATTGVALLLALVPAGGRDRRAWDAARLRSAALGGAVTALMWLPPLVEQVTRDPGNLSELLARRGTGSPVGFGTAAATMSQAFAALPSVLDPARVTDAFLPIDPTAPWWLAVPTIGLVMAARHGDRVHLRGLAVAAGALLGSLLGIAMISDALYGYLATWSRGVVVVTLALGAGAALGRAAPRTRAVAFAAAATVTVVASLVIGARQIGADNPQGAYGATVDALARSVPPPGAATPVLSVDAVADVQASEVAAGLLLRLERDGHRVTSRTFDANRIGAHRHEREPERLLVVAPLGQAQRLVDEGWEVLGAYQPLSRGEAERADALLRALAELPEPRTDEERIENFRRATELSEEFESLTAGRVPMLVAQRPA